MPSQFNAIAHWASKVTVKEMGFHIAKFVPQQNNLSAGTTLQQFTTPTTIPYLLAFEDTSAKLPSVEVSTHHKHFLTGMFDKSQDNTLPELIIRDDQLAYDSNTTNIMTNNQFYNWPGFKTLGVNDTWGKTIFPNHTVVFNAHGQRSQPHQRLYVPSTDKTRDEEGKIRPLNDADSCALSIKYGNAGFLANTGSLASNTFGSQPIAQDVNLTRGLYDIDNLAIEKTEKRFTEKVIGNLQTVNNQRKEVAPISANICALRPMIMWNRSGNLEDLSFSAWISYHSVLEIEMQNGRFDVFDQVNNWNGSNTLGVQGIGQRRTGQA